jgi:pyruvate kinase
LSWRATKIVCTLGPATDAPGVLEALVAAGDDQDFVSYF